MKSFFRKLLSPILNIFESGEGEFNYRKSHRTILISVGVLFFVISSVSAFATMGSSQVGAFIPIVVFSIASFICLVVGVFGNERAIATIWGSK